MGVVYKIVSPSGKVYIGQTKRKLPKHVERYRALKRDSFLLLRWAIRRARRTASSRSLPSGGARRSR